MRRRGPLGARAAASRRGRPCMVKTALPAAAGLDRPSDTGCRVGAGPDRPSRGRP